MYNACDGRVTCIALITTHISFLRTTVPVSAPEPGEPGNRPGWAALGPG